MKVPAKIVVSAVGFLISFGLGYLCASLPFGEGNGKGDVTKVSKYSKKVVSPQASALQEKIMNDPEEFERAKALLDVFCTRIEAFGDLVGYSIEVGDGVEEFASVTERMKGISTMAENAKATAQEARDAFQAMVDGSKDAAADYEAASQKLLLAYMLIDRQLGPGEAFADEAEDFLRDRKLEENAGVASCMAFWAKYILSSSILRGDFNQSKMWLGESEAVIWMFDEAARWRNVAGLDAMGQVVESVNTFRNSVDALRIFHGTDVLDLWLLKMMPLSFVNWR